MVIQHTTFYLKVLFVRKADLGRPVLRSKGMHKVAKTTFQQVKKSFFDPKWRNLVVTATQVQDKVVV